MKRECRAFRPLLGALHDRELNQVTEESVREHLKTCADCQRELVRLEHLTSLTRKVGPPELAEDYWDWVRARVQRRLEQDRRPRQQFYRPSFVWPRVATLAGALVVVLVVVLVGWQTMGPGLLRHEPVRRPERVQPSATSGLESAEETAPSLEQKAEPVLVGKSGRVSGPSKKKVEVEAAATVQKQEDHLSEDAAVPQAAVETPAQTDKVESESNERVQGQDERFSVSARHRSEERPRPVERRFEGRRAGGAGQTVLPERLSAPPLPQVGVGDTGTVLVEITTDNKGNVIAAVVRRSSGIPLLDSLAVENARASKFRLAGSDRRHRRSFEYPYRFEPAPTKAHE